MTSCVVEEQLRIRDSFVYVCPTVSVNSTEELSSVSRWRPNGEPKLFPFLCASFPVADYPYF